MTGLASALLAVVLLVGSTPVMPVSEGNALTLPAQRHVVRIDTGEGRPPTWLMAVQQGHSGNQGLGLFRSDDGGRTFRWFAPIQPDGSHTDRTDMVAVGRDVALIYSYEGPRLVPSSRHDVWFQWWRYQSSGHTWVPEPAVRVFDATTDATGFFRALLARDSRGRLWVQAFRLEPDGASTAVISVSTDNGATFQRQSDLGRVRRRGGGRLLSVGTKLVFFFAMHDGFEPTRLRIRDDDAPLNAWSPQRDAFSEGIYHGAALSAVEDGHGGLHLVYKDETERLFYRHFDGNTFGPRTLLGDTPNWAIQPAITRIGDVLYVFYTHMLVPNANYQLRARVLRDGVFSGPIVLDGRTSYKGYLNAVESLPAGSSEVPCFFGDASDADVAGNVRRVAMPTVSSTGSEDGGTGSDGGTSTDGGTSSDGGTDGGTSIPYLETVFSDVAHEPLGVDGEGTVYAVSLSENRSHLFASTDGGRTFTARGQGRGGAAFWVMTALEDGTLLAQVSRADTYLLQRSTDRGRTWTDVLPLGRYHAASPHSFAVLGSTLFFLEYQTFSPTSVPVRLWASLDQGATWTVRATFEDRRMGVALFADPTRNVLWASFGNSRAHSAVMRSTDGGRTWSLVLSGYAATGAAGAVMDNGALLFGQATLFEPEHPKLLRLFANGRVDALLTLPGPASSLEPLPGGGWVLSTSRDDSGDVQPPEDGRVHVFTSRDGTTWHEALSFERASDAEPALMDVWGELPSGELLVRAQNVQGFGSGGKGFQVLRVRR
ncbi:exo-alpha-sialidase [Myxococcaceae bacterium JPH2]|nr:exo-alpha-sialidase [Myxococcaceae bacterium JPH2]